MRTSLNPKRTVVELKKRCRCDCKTARANRTAVL